MLDAICFSVYTLERIHGGYLEGLTNVEGWRLIAVPVHYLNGYFSGTQSILEVILPLLSAILTCYVWKPPSRCKDTGEMIAAHLVGTVEQEIPKVPHLGRTPHEAEMIPTPLHRVLRSYLPYCVKPTYEARTSYNQRHQSHESWLIPETTIPEALNNIHFSYLLPNFLSPTEGHIYIRKREEGEKGDGKTMSPTPPEQYHVHAPTSHVPNSRLPVLIYRSALPRGTGSDLTTAASAAAATARDLIERNHWFYGGTFKTYWRHHFHSVTHECYAVIRGQSRMLLGVGPLDCEVEDEDEDEGREEEEGEKGGAERRGVEVVVGEGDVIVLPVSVHTISSCVLGFGRIGRPIFVGFGRGVGGGRKRGGGGNRDTKYDFFDGRLLTKKRQAGVSHCSITSEREYEYLGLYPQVRRRVFKRLLSRKPIFYHADSLWHSRGVRSTTTISAKLGKRRQG